MFKDIHHDDFKPFQDKITWILYDDPPNLGKRAWDREYAIRNLAAETIREHANNGTISKPFVVISADADELLDPEVIKEFQPGGKFSTVVTSTPTLLHMKMFYYNFNWRKWNTWFLAHVLPGESLIDGSFDLNQCRHKPFPESAIPDAGWHASYFLSVPAIKRKIESFSHQEYNRPQFKSDQHLLDCISNGKDLFMRGRREKLHAFDYHTLPQPLQLLHEEAVKLQNASVVAVADGNSSDTNTAR